MASFVSAVSKAGLILSCGFMIASAENLLVNNSFENGSAGWQQWGAVSTSQCYAGAKAMAVTNTAPEWSGISQEVPIVENAKTITVSGWMKTDSVVVGENEWEEAMIAIEFLDENGTPYKYYPDPVASKSGSTDWTYFEKSYDIYRDASAMKLVAALGNCTGTASFDQFTVVQKKADGTAILLTDIEDHKTKIQKQLEGSHSVVENGSFEENDAGWKGYNADYFLEGRDGSTALVIENKDFQWGGASQIINLPEEAAFISVSGWAKSEKIERGKEGWDKLLLSVEFMNDDEAKIGEEPQSVAELEGSHDWTFFQRRYGIDEGVTQLKVTGQLCNGKGKALFDDISVVLYDAAGREIK